MDCLTIMTCGLFGITDIDNENQTPVPIYTQLNQDHDIEYKYTIDDDSSITDSNLTDSNLTDSNLTDSYLSSNDNNMSDIDSPQYMSPQNMSPQNMSPTSDEDISLLWEFIEEHNF